MLAGQIVELNRKARVRVDCLKEVRDSVKPPQDFCRTHSYSAVAHMSGESAVKNQATHAGNVARQARRHSLGAQGAAVVEL